MKILSKSIKKYFGRFKTIFTIISPRKNKLKNQKLKLRLLKRIKMNGININPIKNTKMGYKIKALKYQNNHIKSIIIPTI